MILVTFVSTDRATEINPSVSLWMDKCDYFTFTDLCFTSTAMFAEVDDDIYDMWLQKGNLISNIGKDFGGDIGLGKNVISISRRLNSHHLKNKEIVKLTDYNNFVVECFNRGMEINDFPTTDDIMLGWSR